MQYNTRRKSISLQALGIQIPQTSRAHRTSISKLSIDLDHPSKRIKREHSPEVLSAKLLPSVISPSIAAITATTKTVTFADRPSTSGNGARGCQHTPPPSPGASTELKIDYSSVNDDIVAGVLEQLEQTGNRPHLIKELASVLSTINPDVSRSANPAALLSSRLASYMRRSWSSDSPCPVAKELIPIHPRKVFYYLTISPRQGLPASALEPQVPVVGGRGKSGPNRIISPSLSNASQDDEASNGEERKRAALSPSPEVDLGVDMDEMVYNTSPDNTPDFPIPSGNGPSSFHNSTVRRQSSESDRDLRRAPSPALEGDEEEFTATARDMRMKEMETIPIKVDKSVESIENEDTKVDSHEDATKLSLSQHASPAQAQKHESILLSSPLVKASPFGGPVSSRMKELDSGLLGDGLVLSWDIRRPQSVGLDELDEIFDRF